MLKAIIFDMDGVLVDSEPVHFKATALALEEFCGISLDYEYYQQFVGSTVAAMWKEMVRNFHIVDYTWEQLLELCDKVLALLLEEEGGYPEIPGVVTLVRNLYDQGYLLAVASSSPRARIIKNLKKLEISDCFREIVSGMELENPKPAPDIFLKAAEMLQVNPCECLVIEDSSNGVKAAKAAKMACLGYENPHSGPQDLWAADFLATDFDSVDKRLLNMIHAHCFKEPWTVLETERLIIREMVPEDVDVLYEIYAAPSVTKYIEDLYPDKDKERAYIENYYEHVYRFYCYGMWILTLKDGTVIGRAGIENNDKGEIVLGYVIGEEYQRRGYAYEACQAIVNYAKEELEIDEITVYVHRDNTASIRLAEKLGVKIVHDTWEEKRECWI